MAGAPQGNQNAAKGKVVCDAIRKALADDDWRRLKAGSQKVADAYANGEPWAVQFVADRMDGKPTQALEHSGPDGGAIPAKVEVILVRPGGA